MLRSSYEQRKENAPRSTGCGCGCASNRVRLQQTQGMQPLAANRLRPDVYSSTALRDVTLQRGNACGYNQRPRSKSSNEEIMQRMVAVANYQQKISVAASTECEYAQEYKRLSSQRVVSYNHIVKREIQEILQQDRGPITSTAKSYRTLTRPTVLVTSNNHTNDAYQRQGPVASARLVVPNQQVRRHSCSSLNSEDNDYEATKAHFQRSYGQYRKKGYASGANTNETVYHPTTENAVIYHKTESIAEQKNILQKFFSPVLPNRFTNINTLISNMPGQIREPKLKKRASKYLYESIYVGDIYNEEYLPEIFQYLRMQGPKIALNKSFLNRFNPHTEKRAGILNWALSLQSNLNFSDSEYYVAVNLMDHVLASTTIPTNMYQLIFLSTIWIAMKLLGSVLVKASRMIRVCNGAYLAQQLIDMEKKVLKIVDFKMHTTEPSLCINYYLKLLKLADDPLVNATIYYIMDSFSLTPYFSSTPVVVLAAACVKYTFTQYYDDASIKSIHSILNGVLTRRELDEMSQVEKLIYIQMTNVEDSDYPFKQPLHKYHRKERSIQATQTL